MAFGSPPWVVKLRFVLLSCHPRSAFGATEAVARLALFVRYFFTAAGTDTVAAGTCAGLISP
jgi:hypothetical protein